MSTHLQVWSKAPFELPAQLPLEHRWIPDSSEWKFAAEPWSVHVRIDNQATPEPLISQGLPDAAYVAYLSLEPDCSDKAASMMLNATARSLTCATGGICVDADEDLTPPHRQALPGRAC